MAEVCEIDEHFKGTKCNVDRRILFIWMLPVALAILAFWAVVLWAHLTPNLSFFGITGLLELFLYMLLGLLALGVPSFAWFYIRYRALTYNITETEVVINEGVVNKKRAVLPFVLIQDIHIQRPIVYQLLGLSIVEFETGSARGTVEGYLPGVANAEELVKGLLAKVNRIRKMPDVVKSEDKEVLANILEELKHLRAENRSLANNPPGTSNLEKEISKILQMKEGAEPAIEKPKVCLPAEHLEPDRLAGKKGKK